MLIIERRAVSSSEYSRSMAPYRSGNRSPPANEYRKYQRSVLV